MTTNLYEVIGVPRTATEAEIAKAYRVKSLQCHPDRNPDGAEAFKALAAAYEVLKDGDKRALYDATGRVEGSEGGNEGPTLQDEDMDKLVGDFYKSYRGSAEELADIVESYTKVKGNFAKMLTEELIFENTKGEVERLRDVVKGLVDAGRLKRTPLWEKTMDEGTVKKLKRRMKREREEAADALAELRDAKMGASGKMGTEGGGMASLQALILGRQQANKDAFHAQLDDMAARYGGAGAKKKSSGRKN